MNQRLRLPEQEPKMPLSAGGSADRTAVPQGLILPPIPAPLPKPFIRRVWPLATIIFGLALTLAWVCILGYLLGRALVTLIGLVI